MENYLPFSLSKKKLADLLVGNQLKTGTNTLIDP
jgi:hypothetical protein